MADIRMFVKKVVNELIKSDYPHLRLPAGCVAKITGKAAAGQGYVYSIRILKKNGEEDDAIPEIPGVYDSASLEKGDVVAVVLLYGDLTPCIVRRIEWNW